MKGLIEFALVSGLLVSIQGCVVNGDRVSGVGEVRFVPQSEPDSVEEAGVGQDPATGGIFIQWYSAAGASGYNVYRSDSTDAEGHPTGFSLVGNVVSSSSLNDTSIVDAISVRTGVRYYYWLKAYASDGSSSDPSDTIDFCLLDRPSPSLPGKNASVDRSDLHFQWHDNTGGGYTVIRVKDISVIPAAVIWVSRRFQVYGTAPAKTFDFDSTSIARLTSGHSYQWRVDRFNPGADEGARSNWQTFTVQ